MDETHSALGFNSGDPSVVERLIVAVPMTIPVGDIEPDPEQPRRHFDPEKLQELVDSIRSVGIMQRPAVRQHPDPVKRAQGRYMLIFGERRWRASHLAGLLTISCDVYPELSEFELRQRQFKENADRDNLNPVEEAEALDRMLQMVASDGQAAPQERLAAELRMDKGTLSRKLAVLRYPADVRGLVRDGVMTQVNALAKVNKLSVGDREVFIQHAYQQAKRQERVDISLFLKDPAAFLRRVKGGPKTGDVDNPPPSIKAKAPPELMVRWALSRADIIKVADRLGETDLVVFLREATDDEVRASFATLKAKILGTLPHPHPAEVAD